MFIYQIFNLENICHKKVFLHFVKLYLARILSIKKMFIRAV